MKDKSFKEILSRPTLKADYELIRFTRDQTRYKGRGKRDSLEAWAYDTETLKGNVFLIADSYGNHVWKPTRYKILDFLMRKEHESKLGFCYNLRFDAQGLLKLFPEELLKAVIVSNHTGWIQCGKGRVFDVEYKGDKGVVIREGNKDKKTGKMKGKHVVKLFDLATFYQKLRLDTAIQKFLPEEYEKIKKIDIEKVIGVKMEDWTEEIIERYKDLIIKYCVRDCVATARLGELTKKTYERKYNLFERLYVSPSFLGERYLMKVTPYLARTHSKKFSLAKIDHALTNTSPMEYGWLCYSGGWFECFKRGHFKRLYSYDINSAYPEQMRYLVNLDPFFKKGGKGGYREWLFSKRGIPEGVKYGFIKATVEIDKKRYLSPIPLRVTDWGNPVIIHPVGEFSCYLTLNEYKFINRYLGKAKMIDGWFFLCDPDTPQAIFRGIDRLYKEKQRLKKLIKTCPKAEIEYLNCKLLLNSLYGKFIQKTEHKKLNEKGDFVTDYYQPGNLFNSPWAAVITSEVRLKIAKALLGREQSCGMIATDGILTTEPLSDLDFGNGLGQWTDEGSGEGVIVGSGVYQIKGKQPKTKTRSFQANFGTLKNPETDLFAYLNDHRKSKEILTEFKRPLTLMECLLPTDKKYNISRINEFVLIRKHFHLSDNKRIWESENPTCGELLTDPIDSKPHLWTRAFEPVQEL